MAHSMTAFARVEHNSPFGTLSWEIRSVNHRYLEPHIRLPEVLRGMEPIVRERLRHSLSRGKIECTLKLTETEQTATLHVNQDYARQLIHAAEQVAQQIAQPAPLDPLAVLQWPGVLNTQSQDTQALQEYADTLLQQTLTQLLDNRAREGTELARLISERLAQIEQEVAVLREQLPMMLDYQRQKILTRCQDIAVEMDPLRLEQELVLLAQRSDVTEELDRLLTHITEVHHVLTDKAEIGRRLDFLMQELNREANTLGSKAIDTRTTQASVNIKVLIEQMREQIQNIE